MGDRKGRKKKVVCAARALYPPPPAYRPAHAWRIDRNRRGEFPMRGGSYLIHSRRVLPTPRGDYFTADWGGNRTPAVMGRRGRGAEDNASTRHAPFRKSMSRRPASTIQIDRIDYVSMRVRPVRRRTTRWHFSNLRATVLQHRDDSGDQTGRRSFIRSINSRKRIV